MNSGGINLTTSYLPGWTKHCLVPILFLPISSVLMGPNILQTQDFSEFTVEKGHISVLYTSLSCLRKNMEPYVRTPEFKPQVYYLLCSLGQIISFLLSLNLLIWEIGTVIISALLAFPRGCKDQIRWWRWQQVIPPAWVSKGLRSFTCIPGTWHNTWFIANIIC